MPDVSGLWAVIMTVERALRSHAARAIRSHAPSRVGLGPRAGAGQLEAHLHPDWMFECRVRAS